MLWLANDYMVTALRAIFLRELIETWDQIAISTIMV
jgi:hypothetical protein